MFLLFSECNRVQGDWLITYYVFASSFGAIHDFDLLWMILKAMALMFLLTTLIDRTEPNQIRTVTSGEPEPNRTSRLTEPNPNRNTKRTRTEPNFRDNRTEPELEF